MSITVVFSGNTDTTSTVMTVAEHWMKSKNQFKRNAVVNAEEPNQSQSLGKTHPPAMGTSKNVWTARMRIFTGDENANRTPVGIGRWGSAPSAGCFSRPEAKARRRKSTHAWYMRKKAQQEKERQQEEP